jgi:GT2 family glycosyltransferase
LLKTAIVILNWNGRHYLERFLPGVVKYSTSESSFVVIADNGSTDGSLEWVSHHYPSLKIIRFDINYGFTGGYNKALAQIDADFFVLLNSDVEVTPGWLDRMHEGFLTHPNAGVAMPKILSAFEKDYFEYAGASGGYIDILGYPFCRGRILSCIEKDRAQYNRDSTIFWASGAAMMVKSSLYKELGGLDENFFAHMEEIDFCWRAQLAGHEVWAFPSSVVYHVGGGTLPNNSPKKLMLNYRNNLYMLYKNLPSSSRYFILFIRMILDGVSAIIFLLQGKRGFYKAVIGAHNEFFKNRKQLKKSKRSSPNKPTGVMRGSIVLSFILRGGKPKFIDIAPLIRGRKLS